MTTRGPHIALIGCVAVAVASWPGAADARALPPGTDVAVNLSYQSPGGCPSQHAIVEQLKHRGLRVITETAEKRLSIAVAFDPKDARRFKGRLTVEATNGPTLSRAVRGQDCRAVTLSLALVAGLALNPTADVPPGDPGNQDDRADATVATEPDGDNDNDEGGGDAGGDGGGDDRDEVGPAWLVAIAGRGMTGLGVGPALGLGASVERTWRHTPIGAASLVFSAVTAAPGTITIDSGSARLRAYLGRLDGCWYGGVLAARRVVLSPCAGLEGGIVQGKGDNVSRPDAAIRPWFAPVLSARAGVRLTHRVWLSVAGYAFAPLVRDNFMFNAPNRTIYRSPPLGGGLDVGLAAAFW